MAIAIPTRLPEERLNLDAPSTTKHNGGMKRLSVTVHLDADLKERLDKEASRRRCSVSQVVRELILEHLPEPKK